MWTYPESERKNATKSNLYRFNLAWMSWFFMIIKWKLYINTYNYLQKLHTLRAMSIIFRLCRIQNQIRRVSGSLVREIWTRCTRGKKYSYTDKSTWDFCLSSLISNFSKRKKSSKISNNLFSPLMTIWLIDWVARVILRPTVKRLSIGDIEIPYR